MELYFLRHAAAEPMASSTGENDSLRPLTPAGQKSMERAAPAFHALGLSFELILSSPYVRAKQTAEIIAQGLKLEHLLVLTDLLVVGHEPQLLIHELNRTYAKARRVLLVGHEPYLSGLISILVTGDDQLSIPLKKGGLCKLNASSLKYGHCATLEWLLAPDHLTRIQ